MNLPEPWVLKESQDHPGHLFYYNTQTHEATWIRPTPYPGTRCPWPPMIAVQEIIVKHRDCKEPGKKPFRRPLDEARAKAEQCFNEIISGRLFSDVQKAMSDASTKERWITRETARQAFEVGSSLEIGEMARPFEADDGIHIVLRVG